MDEMQSCLDVLRRNDVDVDTAVDRLMGNDNMYLEFIKRLPEELNLAAIREALAQEDASAFHFYLHGLKGFASNLGITEIADTAQAGLIEFRASQFRNITKLEGLLEEIEASGEKFASALGEIKEIEELFNSMGYQLKMGILNASDYGVPQNRRRAVIIGKQGGAAPGLPKPRNITVTIWDAISDLAYLSSGEGEEEQEYRGKPRSEYQKKLRGGSGTLRNHVATRHSRLALERLAMIPPNAGKEVLPEEHLTRSIYSGTWTRMRKDEISVTITTRFDTPSSGKFTHPFLDRAITVREAARIQSFPDSFRFVGSKGSQMKQVGNAVPPLLARLPRWL